MSINQLMSLLGNVGTEGASPLCRNCGHREVFHQSLFGLPLGCDFCIVELDECMDDDGSNVFNLCGCHNFVPVQVGSGAEVN